MNMKNAARQYIFTRKDMVSTKYFKGQYAVATIFTHRKRLVVKQQENKIIKSFSFPIKDHIIDPLLSAKKRKA